MTRGLRVRARGHKQATAPRGRRFRRRCMPPATGYRAITLGPDTTDWAVVAPGGDVVYRGYMIYAARRASELNRAAAAAA